MQNPSLHMRAAAYSQVLTLRFAKYPVERNKSGEKGSGTEKVAFLRLQGGFFEKNSQIFRSYLPQSLTDAWKRSNATKKLGITSAAKKL